MPLKTLLPSLLLSGLISCASHTSIPPITGQIAAVKVHSFNLKRDVIYTPKNWPQALLADVYRPIGSGPWPGVLLIHGGGWGPDDRRGDMDHIARRLVKRGYVVMNATYRLAPTNHYPAPVEDLQQALVWMQNNASSLRLQSDHIAAFGYSAGGHLAEMLGVTKSPTLPRLKAVVAGGAPSDLRKFPDGPLVIKFLGGNMAEKPSTYQAASPITQVTPDDPPFFLYHGQKDKLVPIDQTTDFASALEKSGVPYEIYWLKGRGHVGAFLTDDFVITAAIKFLDRYLREN